MSDAPERPPSSREASLCPCKSERNYNICCQPFHNGKAKPQTAEQLMRSRYSAYFFRKVDYLVETTHPDTRSAQLKSELEASIYHVNWAFLSILNISRGGPKDKAGKVEFVADYFQNGEPFELHEKARFKRFKGAWKYLDGKSGAPDGAQGD